MEVSRRGLLIGGAALICAPAIVRASSLMKVRVIEPPDYYFTAWGDILNNKFEPIRMRVGLSDGWKVGDTIAYQCADLAYSGDRKIVAIHPPAEYEYMNSIAVRVRT